jgi:hypothetical protein
LPILEFAAADSLRCICFVVGTLAIHS